MEEMQLRSAWCGEHQLAAAANFYHMNIMVLQVGQIFVYHTRTFPAEPGRKSPASECLMESASIFMRQLA